MSRVQFITSEYMFKFTIVEDNVDATLITKFIYKSQDLNIQSVLGSNLYNKFVTDCPNFTGSYLTLMKDYIQPAIAEWTVYHLLPFLNFKLTNKAISQKSSDNSNPSNLDDIKYLRDQVRNNAEFYSERIRDYIMNNPTLFPEFYTQIETHIIPPNRNNYFSGVYSRRIRNRFYNSDDINDIDENNCCD
jgi:hypothetical protein